MMESNNPTPQVPNEPVEEEDPLLELARIVSGDDLQPKLEPVEAASEASDQPTAMQQETTEAPAGSTLDKELEAALLDDLSVDEAPQSAPSMLPDQPAPQLEEPVHTAAVTPPPAAPVIEPEPPVVAPTIDPVSDMGNAPPITESNEQRLEEFESSLEQQLLDEIDAEVAGMESELPQQNPAGFANQELPTSAGPVEAVVETQPPVVEPPVYEPAPAAPPADIPVHEPLQAQETAVSGPDPLATIETAITDESPEESVTEEDLGKIFAAEFEQINAEHSGVDQASDLANEFEQIQVQTAASSGEMAFMNSDTAEPHQADVIDEDEIASLIEEDLDQTLKPDESQELLGDMDAEFASAFNDELAQNDILSAAKMGGSGWDDQVSQDAELEFAAAVPGLAAGTSESQPLPEPEHLTDPSLLDEPAAATAVAAGSEQSGSGSGIKMAAIALGVALFAGLGAVSYGYMTGEAENTGPIVVKADSEPVKVKPADPGGRKVANTDKASYNKVDGNDEATEQATLVSTKEVARVIAPKKSGDGTEPAVGQTLEPVANDQVAGTKPTMTPRKVRTFTVKPDGTIIAPDPVVEPSPQTDGSQDENQVLALQTNDGSQATRSIDLVTPRDVSAEGLEISPNQSTDTGNSAAQTALVEPVRPEDDPGRIEGATSTGAIGIPSPSPLPKPAAAAPATPTQPKQATQDQPVQIANLNNQEAATTDASSPWVVQISSQKSEAAALSSLKNLQRRFPSLLNGRQANIKEAAITGKGTFYRVRVNTQSRDDAGKFCARFKAAGGSCFVTR